MGEIQPMDWLLPLLSKTIAGECVFTENRKPSVDFSMVTSIIQRVIMLSLLKPMIYLSPIYGRWRAKELELCGNIFCSNEKKIFFQR